MKTEDLVKQIQAHLDNLHKGAVEGSLLLADLTDSTRFKTGHPEHDWLKRLLEFREAVKFAIGPAQPVKFLGDGVLCFLPAGEYPSSEVCAIAKKIMNELTKISAERNYTSDFILSCRIILDFGRVFMFDDKDPQGTPVDRLFRLEKYVPRGSIGVTERFRQCGNLGDVYSLGRYSIRGIGRGRHELYLLDKPSDETLALVEQQREISALTDIWSLGANHEGPIYVVGGRIPETEPETYTVQSGDKDALVEAVLAIARAGRMDDVHILTGTESQELYLRENIVTIGGPYYNSWTRRLMREAKSPLIFDLSTDDVPLHNQVSGQQFSVTRHGDRIIRDYGFFARLRNPMNPEKHIVMACGIETYGVLGAARLVTGVKTNAHFLKLHEHLVQNLPTAEGGLRDFFLLSAFEVNEQNIVGLDTLDVQISGLISNWRDIRDLKLQEPPLAGYD